MSLLDALLHHIKSKYPRINRVHLVSDNGSHFASHDLIYFLHRMNIEFGENLVIVDYVFSEATWGSCPSKHYLYLSIARADAVEQESLDLTRTSRSSRLC